MGQRTRDISPKKPSGQQAHEKMCNITHYQFSSGGRSQDGGGIGQETTFSPTNSSKEQLNAEQISQFSSVQLLSRGRFFATTGIAARQASLSITNSRSLLKLMSIESVMPSSHLILCRPLLLLPPVPPSIRVFSRESTIRMRRPKSLIIREMQIKTTRYHLT